MRLSRFHPESEAQVVARRWTEEAEAEKVVTETERQDFRLENLLYRRDAIEARRAFVEVHKALIAEATKALDRAIERNGFTERFHISIKGDW